MAKTDKEIQAMIDKVPALLDVCRNVGADDITQVADYLKRQDLESKRAAVDVARATLKRVEAELAAAQA